MYYVSRFAVIGVFIFSFFVFSGWNHKGEVQRDIASVQPAPSSWKYEGSDAQTEEHAWQYEAQDSYPKHKAHKPHFSPKYKM